MSGGRGPHREGLRAGMIGWPVIAVLVAMSGVMAALQLAASIMLLALHGAAGPRGAGSLAGLIGLAVFLFVLSVAVEFLRARCVCRAGLEFVRLVYSRRPGFSLLKRADRLAWLADLERVRRFVIQPGSSAIFDALWLPVWIAAAAVVHPKLGIFSGSGVFLIIGATLFAQQRVNRACGRATRRGRADSSRETLLSSDAELRFALRSTAKGLLFFLQACGLGLAIFFVIDGAMDAGALVASSLILGRTFVSLDAALALWPSFIAAHESYSRLAPHWRSAREVFDGREPKEA